MQSPLILVIDDSMTARKMVEFHLNQSGFRVISAPDAERGLELARTMAPELILLDHQLPGTTGDEVCRRLLQSEATARIPVVISSAMRNRAFASYTELANVVDQIPKPYTPELLKSGVANALKTGAMVVNAQRTGCAMPESVDEPVPAALEGNTNLFPLPGVLAFLSGSQQDGQLTLEVGTTRFRFVLTGGRIQAVVSSSFDPAKLASLLPTDLADLAPLTTITLREQHDAQTNGLIQMLERSLSDPRRLRALLRFQAAVLTYHALCSDPGRFTFEPEATLPPMFQAFPLQVGLTVLAVEGARRCESIQDAERWAPVVLARQAQRGGNLDRLGLSPAEMRLNSVLDGSQNLGAIARSLALPLSEIAIIARGFELAGLVERRTAATGASVLVVEGDPDTIKTIQGVFGPDGKGFQIKMARDRVSAQLLLRRSKFDMVLMALDRPDQEQFYRLAKSQVADTTRFVGILKLHDESELVRLEAMGLDGILHRPLTEDDLLATVTHLIEPDAVVPAVVAPRARETAQGGHAAQFARAATERPQAAKPPGPARAESPRNGFNGH
jgi:DNA-binding response OmpR family regulator